MTSLDFLMAAKKVEIEQDIGRVLANAIEESGNESQPGFWQFLLGCLENGYYTLYVHGNCVHWTSAFPDARSTAKIIGHFVYAERAPRDLVPFIRFLYEYTDAPWRIYAALGELYAE